MYTFISGDFNQAIMELGATICTPKNPKCVACPVHEHCQALLEIEEWDKLNDSLSKKVKIAFFKYI